MARRMKKRTKVQQGVPRKFGKSIGRAAIIGLFGGLIWSPAALVCQLLNFSSVGPSLLFSPFPIGSWKNQIGGQFLAVALLSLISIPLALIYQLALSRIKSMWVGIGFGILLWGVVFIVLRRWIPDLPPIGRIGWNTLTTTLCLFILYGLFVGYSIAFEIEENSGSGNYSNE